ncbi:MAG: ArsR family transcriptional regulator [Candidatus Heimdallarchaeota archaeon]|nr:ArsR family transcriptional regulator [Candidatus Heimdallarchaeota archaeon]MCK5143155.1 ArsR family transcriptional regulator [Candidatus Heimdallarchaeota archaeon]
MLGNTEENQELDVFELLEFLSNSTRRKILGLLAEEDLYSFQLSRLLDVSPRIIAKYLAELENIGIVSMVERGSDKGPTRKYAKLNQSFSLIIDVGQNTFNVNYFPTSEVVQKLSKEESKKQKELKIQISKELADIRNCVKEKIIDVQKLDSQRKIFVQKINESYIRFNEIVEKTVYDYYDRDIIRNIFKISLNKPENKVSLTELANRTRIWRGDLGNRLERLANETEFVKCEKDRRGEVWYSI